MINTNDEQAIKEYPPSWFDKFSTWVGKLPGPSWVYYLGFGIFLLVVGAIIQLVDTSQQSVEFPPTSLISIFQIVYVLTLLDFLDKRAASSLEEFRPILKADDSQYMSLKTRLTTRPSRPVMLASIIFALVFGSLGIISMNFLPVQTADSTFSVFTGVFTKSPFGYYSVIVGALLWMINGIFIYRTFHQIRTIDFIYTHQADINLFQQTELYAFSKVSASIAIGLVLTSPVWMIIDPGLITMGINIFFAILAIFIFVSPLLGVHSLLKRQKDELAKDSNSKKEALIRELFDRLEKNDFDQIEKLEKALSSLGKAENEIKKISTWPWQTDTLRQMIGALLLPITIWIIQYFLSKLLAT
jgi:hypothetical protein